MAWSGIPAEGSTVTNSLKGGDYRLLVVSSTGAAVLDLEVDGDERITARLSTGGAVHGEIRRNGEPFAAEIWMPVPGRAGDRTSALSHIVRATPDGRFKLDRLPPGKWILSVGTSASGYKEVEIDVKEGKVTEAGYIEVR